jgi:RimJ/RimL family protein N-acetyltransferase
VGDLTVHQCDRRSGTFSYGVSIASVHRRKGYAREAILLALRYYFGELRYNKVTVFVYSFNAPSIGLHESLRFRKEGELRQMAVTGGCYCEQHVYGLTAREFAELYGFDFPAQAPR